MRGAVLTFAQWDALRKQRADRRNHYVDEFAQIEAGRILMASRLAIGVAAEREARERLARCYPRRGSLP